MSSQEASSAAKQCFAWAFTCAICVALAWAYRRDGWQRVGLLYVWLGSLVATQMSVHGVLRSLGFPFPTFLTFLQFAMLSIPMAPLLGRARPGASATSSGMPFLSWRFVGFFTRRVLPIVLAHTVAIVMNNMSLGLIDPGLNVVLGSMTPAITGALAFLFGDRLSMQRWAAVFLVVFGGCLAIRGGVQDSFSSGGQLWIFSTAWPRKAACFLYAFHRALLSWVQVANESVWANTGPRGSD